MKNNLLKLYIFCAIFALLSLPAYSSDLIKTKAQMLSPFTLGSVPDELLIKVDDSLEFKNGVVIPKNSILKIQLYQYQKERRWHKSGFFMFKPIAYSIDGDRYTFIGGDDTYFAARKYEQLDKKDAAVTTFEIAATTGASVFLPAIDLGYFFVKGAIQREDDPNWFKSGVSTAYRNSICWFWLKGKSIELDENDYVSVKQLKKRKAEKLKLKIDKRRLKEEYKNEKRALKSAKKRMKNGDNVDYEIIGDDIEQRESF